MAPLSIFNPGQYSSLQGHGHNFGQKLYFGFNVYNAFVRQFQWSTKLERHSSYYKRDTELAILSCKESFCLCFESGSKYSSVRPKMNVINARNYFLCLKRIRREINQLEKECLLVY